MSKGKLHYSKNWDGGIHIGYLDTHVEVFGGLSYEANYDIDFWNVRKLRKALRKNHSGTLKKMIIEEFGEYMEKNNFVQFCNMNGIQLKAFSWFDD